MGKVDDMRAMREARYAAQAKSQKMEPAPDTSWVHMQEINAKGVKGQHVPLDTESCGHRSISGGYCTRPKDHPEKNHRYKPLNN